MIVRKEIIDKVVEEFIGDSVFTFANSVKREAIRELKSAVKNAALIEIKINATTVIASAVTFILKKEFLQRKEEVSSSNSIYDENYDTPKDWTVFNFNGTPIFIIAPIDKPYTSNYMPYRRPYKMYSEGIVSSDIYAPDIQRPNMPNISDGSYRLITFRSDKNLKNMKKFIHILTEKGLERIWHMENSPYVTIYSHCDGSETTVRKRFLDSVFMNTDTKKELMSSVANFVNKRKWYDKNMIPYHYGIMLYGPSGTGKSTLIRAFISTYVEKLGLRNMENPLYLRSPSEMLMNPNEINSDTKYPRIIIIEDIDATILKKREKVADNEEEYINNNLPHFRSYQDDTSLSEILNKLDGLTNLENVIYVFTTNHIENLDPALVRPGRIDKLIHVDLPDRCAYNQFCQYHFGKSIPKDFEIKSNKLIAELQSEIVGGKDFDGILEILGKED